MGRRGGEEKRGSRYNGPSYLESEGGKIAGDQPGQKKTREGVKMVKQHLFFTKEKQRKCQESPAFSLLPFHQRNCARPGWAACQSAHCSLFFPHLVPLTVIPQSLEKWQALLKTTSPNQLNGRWPHWCFKAKRNATCPLGSDSPYHPPVSDFSTLKKTLRGNCKAPPRTVPHCPPPPNKLGMGEFSIGLQLSTVTCIVHIFTVMEKGISTTAWLWKESWKLSVALLLEKSLMKTFCKRTAFSEVPNMVLYWGAYCLPLVRNSMPP